MYKHKLIPTMYMQKKRLKYTHICIGLYLIGRIMDDLFLFPCTFPYFP